MVLEDLIYSDVLPYAAAFLIFYVIYNYAFSKSFLKDNKQSSTILSISASLLTIWGLVTQTDLFYSFSAMFDNLSESLTVIILIAVGTGIVFVLWKSLKKVIKSKRINWVFVGGGLLLVFIGLFPGLISSYYLPDWFEEYGGYSLWIGGLLLIAGIYDSFNYSKSKVFTAGEGGMELTRERGTLSSRGFWSWMVIVGGAWTIFYFLFLFQYLS